MTSQTSTPRSRSRSRSSTASSGSSDTTMLDAPPLTPARLRRTSHSAPSPAPASAKDPAFSLLLSLPRELRDRIYSFALTSSFPFWWPNPAPIKHNVGLGLLTASRQVYQEAAPLLYSGNKFLFTHPSDCNIFRIISSPIHSALISSVYFRIREKDLRLWTAYLGSKSKERSLKNDLPKLKSLWIFLRCGNIGNNPAMGQQMFPPIMGLPPALAAQVQAVQNALGQQVQALQQQVQNLTQSIQAATAASQSTAEAQPQNGETGDGNNDGEDDQQLPPPPPPPPAMPFLAFAQGGFQAHQHHHMHHHPHPPPGQPHAHGPQNNPPNPAPPNQFAVHQQHAHTQTPHPHHHHGPFYTSFLRWERELGLESLCLSLQETKPMEAEVKIVCIMRLPKPEVLRLLRLYPEELSVDRNGDARTRFRKLHGVEVSLEIAGFDIGGMMG